MVGASYDIAALIIKSPKVVPKEDGERTSDSLGEVKIEDVKFSYPSKSEVQVLKRVNIEVKNNEIVAVVGSSGKFPRFLWCRLRQVLYHQPD